MDSLAKLSDFKRRLATFDRPGLALDIDDTISQTAEHLLSRLAERFGNPENLTIQQIRTRHGMFQHVPQWNRPEVHAFLEELNNSPEILTGFLPMDGVHDALNELKDVLPVRCYLTARPEAMRDHTAAWLKHHGFPEAELVCRPNDVVVTDGSKWKGALLHELTPHIAGIVDDNIHFPGFVPREYPGMMYVFGVDNHSYPDRPNIVACPTWKDVAAAIRKQKNF